MRLFALVPSIVLFACLGGEPGHGSRDSDAGHAPHNDAGHTPQRDAGSGLPGDVYIAGMEKGSTEGHFKVALISSDPIPQDLTLYTWVVELRDAAGTPLENASVIAEPTMPDHGHGTFPATTAGEAGDSTGQFVLRDMDLFMAGTWQIELRIEQGGNSDTVFFHFYLEG